MTDRAKSVTFNSTMRITVAGKRASWVIEQRGREKERQFRLKEAKARSTGGISRSI